MAKETRQQIIENTRKKVASQYAEQVRNLKEKVKTCEDELWMNRREMSKIKQEKSELEIKIKEQEDWIERLISFVNMSPEQREEELKLFRQQQANAEVEKMIFESPLFQFCEKLFI